MNGHEIKYGTRGWHDKTISSGKKVGPFVKNWSFEDSCLLVMLEKCPTSTMHNFFNFELLEVFLDFLKSLRCTLTNPFSLVSF